MGSQIAATWEAPKLKHGMVATFRSEGDHLADLNLRVISMASSPSHREGISVTWAAASLAVTS